ncbi:uncharacterized protein [Zea mays]|jgi:hypothetical protein|uniref:Uncharacterized protein n=1 Tax=Zea mays TaxID=4577 RepID=A0A804Q0E4_MAIZE|nr:uncharacterized protein LOC103630350 [Zea mays]|eukprot:XP_008649635.1 uncharacterized protein LOC103630350 [Zea mays]
MLPASAATPPPAYDRLDKKDAEEAPHVRAQFLIHKVLNDATPSSSRAVRPRSRPPALVRVKQARVGVRLKKLRLAIRGVRARARRAVQRHLRNLRRLIARGGGRGSSSVRPAAAGPPPS